ncbi:cyclodeaminase/cyclohydrolase family protein [Wukongibacter baidiensis]|uniref:cyclodeaminase/cyclohydrolase family protein n=1 Tax=Wukongibacter baidiensis TaxID=1723361 RepID=UPI003D7FC595
MKLVEKTVMDFVNAVESKEPAPGGGSVAALGGSLGGALTAMVGNLTIGRKKFNELDEETKEKFEKAFNETIVVKESLLKIIDEDTEAFNQVMAAFKMPKETEEEKSERKAAINEATILAMNVPLKAAEECLKILKLQEVFAQYGNRNAITDVGVGALMSYSGLEGALLNVKVNLGGLDDQEFVNNIQAKCDSILKEGKELLEATLKVVYSKI